MARLLEGFHNETVNRLLDRINRFLIREGEQVIALGETMRERLIAEKGRAGEIAEIVAELDTLVAAEHRVLDVELTTAHELSDEEFGRILEQIETASGRTVQAERTVDPDLIGGIVLQAGSMRLDASVRGRLERLRHDLTHARS